MDGSHIVTTNLHLIIIIPGKQETAFDGLIDAFAVLPVSGQEDKGAGRREKSRTGRRYSRRSLPAPSHQLCGCRWGEVSGQSLQRVLIRRDTMSTVQHKSVDYAGKSPQTSNVWILRTELSCQWCLYLARQEPAYLPSLQNSFFFLWLRCCTIKVSSGNRMCACFKVQLFTTCNW